jgi:hypothetical protein
MRFAIMTGRACVGMESGQVSKPHRSECLSWVKLRPVLPLGRGQHSSRKQTQADQTGSVGTT